MAKGYSEHAGKYAKVVFVFVCHLILIALSLIGIFLLEKLFHFFWNNGEPLLFDRVPLKYPFQFIDLVLLLLFGYRGAHEINEILKG